MLSMGVDTASDVLGSPWLALKVKPTDRNTLILEFLKQWYHRKSLEYNMYMYLTGILFLANSDVHIVEHCYRQAVSSCLGSCCQAVSSSNPHLVSSKRYLFCLYIYLNNTLFDHNMGTRVGRDHKLKVIPEKPLCPPSTLLSGFKSAVLLGKPDFIKQWTSRLIEF